MLPVFERAVSLQWQQVPGLENLMPLVRHERAEYEAVLGVPVVFRPPSSARDHTWRVQIEPKTVQSRLHVDMRLKSLTSVISSAEKFGETLNLLHTLAHSDASEVVYAEATSYADVLKRISREVAMTFPSFSLRNLDWDEISARYLHLGHVEGLQFWEAVQRWVAELGDAHTAVKPPDDLRVLNRCGPIEYRAEITSHGARMLYVPRGSAAYIAGVREGWMVQVDNPAWWLEATGASPQHHAEVAARRFFHRASPSTLFHASGPHGKEAQWTQGRAVAQSPVWGSSGTSSASPVIRISRFSPPVPDLVAECLACIRPDSPLTIDLRGNTGGNLMAAVVTRDLFVPPGETGAKIQYSDGRGGMGPQRPIPGSSSAPAHTGPLTIWVDSMTYSSAEDFIQPLVGLPHVIVRGGPTGGRSGRPRSVPLKDGYSISISTALTFTSAGNPIEYRGISGATYPRSFE